MGLFGGDADPSAEANQYLDRIAPMEKGYYNPYIQKGNDAYDSISGSLGKMSSDPVAFLEELMKSYTPSRGYNLRRDEALRSAGNTAAAGGMRGSINDIDTESRLTDSLMGEDMQQWLQNVLGIQKEGMGGEQHIFDTGYDATRNLTSDLSNVLGTQGSLAYQGAASKNQSHSDLLSGLMKAAAGGAGFYFGGPAGAAAASKFF